MPSRSEVDAYHLLQQQIVDAGTADVATLARLNNSQAMIAAYPEVVDPYVSASAMVSSEWYQELAPDQRYEPKPAPLVQRGTLERNASWASTQANVERALVGSAERAIRAGGRETIVMNARIEGILWRREAAATACGFCKMTSVGKEFFTGRAAGGTLAFKYHDFCSCVVIPERVGSPYATPDYAKDWQKEYEEAAKKHKGDPDAIANALRPSQSKENLASLQERRIVGKATQAAKQRAALANYPV
jgi:hypothetical protein